MIVHLQFPVADLRQFVGSDTGRLPSPLWPAPNPYNEFIRSFGIVKPRGKGGMTGWIGENEVCDASNALRFSSSLSFRAPDTENELKIVPVARHFFFDGLAVGKFELVFIVKGITKQPKNLSITEIIGDILQIPVTIPVPYEKSIQVKLLLAGKYLARLFLFSSSFVKNHSTLWDKKWTFHGSPIVFCACDADERVILPKGTKKVNIVEKYGFELDYLWFKSVNSHIRLWFLIKTTKDKEQQARSLRLYLLRLHAEYESLKLILKSIDGNRINLARGTQEFDILQRYFNDTTRRISNFSRKTEDILASQEAGELAYLVLEDINPGEKDSLLQKLQLSQMRPNVFNKVSGLIRPSRESSANHEEIAVRPDDMFQESLYLLEIKKRRLSVLEQQASYYGIDCPPHIIMEIEDTRREIERILRSQ
jgi:hypothetical protein